MSCEYCALRNPKPIMDGGAVVTIDREEAQIWVEWYGHDDGHADHETINCCPICGDKLGKDA